MRGFPKIRGTLLGGLHNKDYSILGSMYTCLKLLEGELYKGLYRRPLYGLLRGILGV